MSQLTLEIRLRKAINFPQFLLEIEKEKPLRVLTRAPRDKNSFF
jgi:hypothetical protein